MNKIKGRIVMDDGNVFVKSRSPFSRPGSWQRCCLQKGSEIDIAAVCEAYQKVAAVQPSSRKDAGVIMGVTAEGTSASASGRSGRKKRDRVAELRSDFFR